MTNIVFSSKDIPTPLSDWLNYEFLPRDINQSIPYDDPKHWHTIACAGNSLTDNVESHSMLEHICRLARRTDVRMMADPSWYGRTMFVIQETNESEVERLTEMLDHWEDLLSETYCELTLCNHITGDECSCRDCEEYSNEH